METRFETSFIPQQPLLRVEGAQRRKEPVGLALLLSLVIFFSTLVVAGGVYFFERDAEKKLTAAKEELDERENNINVDEIASLKLLSTRFEVADRVLEGHVAFSALLDLLEKWTSVNIGFTNLEFGLSDRGSNMRVFGEAPSYMSVYVQSEELRNLEHVEMVDVSTVALNETDGIVLFEMEVRLDPDLTKYVRYYDETHKFMPISVELPTITPPVGDPIIPPVPSSL